MGVVAIVESPAKGTELKRQRPGWTILPAVGHLLRTRMPRELGEQYYYKRDGLPFLFDAVPLVPDEKRRDKLADIGRALKSADQLVVATDIDREGSLIGQEIADHHGWRGPTRRLLLAALDAGSVKALLAEFDRTSAGDHARQVERWRCEALEGACRQHDDWHKGLNGTQIATLALKPPGATKGPLSVGPVQSPVLALIVRRDRAIRDFVPRTFWDVRAEVATESGHRLELAYAPREGGGAKGPRRDSGDPAGRDSGDPSGPVDRRIYDRAAAEALAAAAKGARGPLEVVSKPAEVSPPRLFDQAALQQALGRIAGWSPSKTLAVNQELYQAGLLTYPRVQCRFLPENQIGLAGPILAHLAELPDFRHLAQHPALARPVIRKGSRYDDGKAGAHHAIVPTRLAADWDRLSPDQRLLYRVVAQSFLANHLPNAVDQRTQITFEVPAPAALVRLGHPARVPFRASGAVETAPGWRVAYPDRGSKERGSREGGTGEGGEGEGGEEAGVRLPPVRSGEQGTVERAELRESRTEPPKRWTDADIPTVMQRLIEVIDDPMLKRALENPVEPETPKGLGAPSTQAKIVDLLLDRGYVAYLGKGKSRTLEATPLGHALIEQIERSYPPLADPVRRALTEFELGRIGSAASLAEAERLAEAYRREVHRETKVLVEAIGQAEAIAAEIAASGAAGRDPASRQPTKPMRAAIEQIAQAKKLKPPRGYRTDFAVAKAFLDEHAAKRAPGEPAAPSEAQLRLADRLAAAGGRPLTEAERGNRARLSRYIDAASRAVALPPSDKQLKAARAAAERRGVALTPEQLRDAKALSRFLDEQGRPARGPGAEGAKRGGRAGSWRRGRKSAGRGASAIRGGAGRGE